MKTNKLKQKKGEKTLWKLWCESHRVFPSVHSALLISVHYCEALVWFEASGCCCTIDNGFLLGLLLDILFLSCIMEILQFHIRRLVAFTCCNSSQKRCTLGWTNTQSCFRAWVVAILVSMPAFLHHHYLDKLSNSASPSSPYTDHSNEWSKFCSHILGYGWPAYTPLEPVLLFCPRKVQSSPFW